MGNGFADTTNQEAKPKQRRVAERPIKIAQPMTMDDQIGNLLAIIIVCIWILTVQTIKVCDTANAKQPGYTTTKAKQCRSQAPNGRVELAGPVRQHGA